MSQVAAHIASSLLMVAATVIVAAIVAFLVARKYGGKSRLKRQLIFLWVGGFGLMLAGGVMFLRLYPR